MMQGRVAIDRRRSLKRDPGLGPDAVFVRAIGEALSPPQIQQRELAGWEIQSTFELAVHEENLSMRVDSSLVVLEGCEVWKTG